MKRRRVLAVLGTATAVGSTATYLSVGQSEGATAELGSLDVPDVETSTSGDSIESITLTVDSSYEYDSSHNPDSWTLELLVGDNEDTMQPIDSVTETDSLLQSDSGTETLSGAITSTYHFSTMDFEPSNGGEVSRPVWIGLRFELEANGEIVAEETITENVSVTVDGAALEASASLGGEGEITVST